MRVLVVDGSLAMRSRLVELVRLHGIPEVEQAATAEEALRLARARAPDLVTLDLPQCRRLAVIEALKALPRPPAIAVLSDRPTAVHRRWCLARGADHFFDKSIDLARVLDLLRGPTRAPT